MGVRQARRNAVAGLRRGLQVRSGAVVLQTLTITAGQTYGTRYGGGGLRAVSSSPTLKNLVFSGNFSNNDGGGMYCEFGNLSLIVSNSFQIQNFI